MVFQVFPDAKMARQLLWLFGICAVTCAVNAATGPQVSTQSGDLSGTVLKSFLGSSFYSFRGAYGCENLLNAECVFRLKSIF